MNITDRNQLRFNQVLLVVGLLLAFALDMVALVVVLFGLMWSQHLGFDALVWLKRTVGIKPQLHNEDPRPHRFARSVGAVFLGFASLALVLGASVLGWVLALLVAGLALLNLTTQICVGCFLYFQLRMLQHRFNR